MKIGTVSHITKMSGTYKTTDLVFMELEGETVARAKITPANPNSSDQVTVRNDVTVASQAWDTLTAAQRASWQSWGELHMADDSAKVKSLGQRAFVRANLIRQILGLALVTDAPTQAPPLKPTKIEQLGAMSPDSIGLTLTHSITNVAGHMVLVRATDAMNTVACTPRPGDCRYVCGVGPASFTALPVSGASVEFSPTKYVINDGQRYGVEVRIVRTADGIASDPLYGDFIKSV